uniref:C2H2-type domain-containing protein n=1 Tax=Strongyloides papillosus TaxID=174720 RepID=A0A0N5CFI5_STREA
MPGNDDCCYACNECTKSFPSLDQLESHIQQQHHAENTSKDNNNDISLEQVDSSLSNLIENQSTNSPSSSETSEEHNENGIQKNNTYTCRFCPKIFHDRGQLNIHYTHTHRDKPQYVCETCHMVFGVKRELSTHMRIHSGEQPHKCTQCGKEFGTRQLLKKHWMWHTGERSHVCPHCKKAFFQKGHLTQHLMIHAGGRPHQCQLCQKTFIFKFDLNRHMKIHAERGFNCQKCGRSFQKQSQQTEHEIKCKGSSNNTSQQSNGGGKLRSHTPLNSNSTIKESITNSFRFSQSPSTQNNGNNVNSLNFNLNNFLQSAAANTNSLSQQTTNNPMNLALQSTPTNPLDALANLKQTIVPNQNNMFASLLLSQLGGTPQRNNSLLAANSISCPRCSQTFNDTTALAVHFALNHLSNNNNSSTMNVEDASKLTSLMVSSPNTVGPLNQIKLDEHSDSSCASSPQKASPVSDNYSTNSSTASDAQDDGDSYRMKYEDMLSRYTALQQKFDNLVEVVQTINGENNSPITNTKSTLPLTPASLGMFDISKLFGMQADA